MTCGIYVLYYETDDFQYYIGKSTNIEKRHKEHCSLLSSFKHKNKGLKNGYAKFNVVPTVAILEILPHNDTILYAKEVDWIVQFDSYRNGMNETPGGGGTGYGETHTGSIYSNSEIISLVKYIINNPTHNFEKVSKILGISHDVILSVTSGNNHTWLVEAIPLEYQILLSMRGSRKSNCVHYGEEHGKSKYSNTLIQEVLKLLIAGNKIPAISTATGVPTSTIHGIYSSKSHTWLERHFPEDYKLMVDLYNKDKSTSKYPHVTSPEGVTYYVLNQVEFSKTHGLDHRRLSELLRKKRKVLNGWTLQV